MYFAVDIGNTFCDSSLNGPLITLPINPIRKVINFLDLSDVSSWWH